MEISLVNSGMTINICAAPSQYNPSLLGVKLGTEISTIFGDLPTTAGQTSACYTISVLFEGVRA